jgi:hypothetical protein
MVKGQGGHRDGVRVRTAAESRVNLFSSGGPTDSQRTVAATSVEEYDENLLAAITFPRKMSGLYTLEACAAAEHVPAHNGRIVSLVMRKFRVFAVGFFFLQVIEKRVCARYPCGFCSV